jgi:hypothetical protein
VPVQGASIANAIQDILNTETPAACPILSKNKRPFKLLEKEKKQTRETKVKHANNLKIRQQGRVYPSTSQNDYERTLQMIATKGVVRLFNAVAHQQTEIKKEYIKDEQLRQELVQKQLKVDDTKLNSNDTIVKKIMSQEKTWKVFEDEDEMDAEGDQEFK